MSTQVRRWTITGVVALLLCGGLAGDARVPQVSAQSEEVRAAVAEASEVYPVPAHRLFCLFRQESGYRPWANENPPYMGLAQFDGVTFAYAHRVLRNPADPAFALLPPDATPWRARDAALAAAGLIARGEGRRWPPLRQCG